MNWYKIAQLNPSNYRNVDDFIASHGEPVYHGTSKQFTDFDPKMLGKAQGFDEQGFFFTDDRGQAQSYSPLYPNKPNYKMTDEEKELAENIPVIDAYFDKSDVLTMSDLAKLYETGVIKTKPNFDNLIRPSAYFDNNREALKEAIEATGKKVVKVRSNGQTNYMVTDPSMIKTKQKLIDTWNKNELV